MNNLPLDGVNNASLLMNFTGIVERQMIWKMVVQ